MRPALLLLALLLAAPLAAADHAYSHRYVVYGRLVDAEGVGIPEALVEVRFEGLAPEGPCARQPASATEAYGETATRPVTDASGDFQFCFHVHSLPPASDARIVAVAEGARASAPIDPELRAQLITLQEDAPTGAARPDEHVVLGRAWRAEPNVTVEGLRVHGTTVDHAPVHVTLLTDHGRVDATTSTNAYGDFALRVPLEDADAAREAHVRIGERTWTANASSLGITWIRAAIPAPPAAPAQATPDAPTPPPTAPAPDDEIPAPGWAGLAGALLAAVALAPRRR